MDEFTSIGKVEIIAHSVSYMVGTTFACFRLSNLSPNWMPLQQRIRLHNDHQPCTANHLYPAGAAGCEQILRNVGLYHSKTQKRSPRTRTQRFGKRRVPRINAATKIERNESGQRNHHLRRYGTSAKVNKICYYQDGMFTKRLRKPVAVASLRVGWQ